MDSLLLRRRIMASLYQRVLGAPFTRLTPAMRRFHAAPMGATASGHLAVEHGENWAGRALAWLARMPPASPRAAVALKVEVRGNREMWDRRIGGTRAVTWQWDRGGLLLEAAGPLVVGFALVVDDDRAMQFVQQRTWLRGVPLPRWLSPAAFAEERPTTDGWEVDVRLSVPLAGLVLRYHGPITPD
jgi:hypothetical protein